MTLNGVLFGRGRDVKKEFSRLRLNPVRMKIFLSKVVLFVVEH